MRLNRRTVLHASGSIVCLPTLVSLLPRAARAEGPAAVIPKRLIWLGTGFGVTNETWYPDRKTTGKDYVLPAGLAPLQRHKDQFTVLQGLFHKHSQSPHWGSTYWLTGANQFGVPGKNFHNTISVDQVAAEHLGRDTRWPSLQMDSEDAQASGHGPGLSLAWNAQGKPVSASRNPIAVFHAMFSGDDMPLAERRAILAKRQSVLDALRADTKRVARRLTANDREKLEEYLQSIRDIENSLAREARWLEVSKPAAPDVAVPEGALRGAEEIKVMYDLIAAALQTDLTRVITYRQPVGTLLQSLDIQVAPHDMSHYGPGIRQEASQARDRKQSELLAGLLDRLLTIKESDGTPLLNHTALVYGSNIRTIHYLDNCPTLVAGGGAGIRLGEHAVFPDKTPLCNLWLTLLQNAGVGIKSFGDSTGGLKDVIA
jgi:hypothetical protein